MDQLERETFGNGQFRVQVQLVETTSTVIDHIRQIDGVVSVERAEDRLYINCLRDIRPQIVKAIVEADGLPIEINLQHLDLEDIYKKYFTGS